MTGHSHYTIDPKKTALFVIDPQNVYAKCPVNSIFCLHMLYTMPVADKRSALCDQEVTGEPTVENLIQSPSAEVALPLPGNVHVCPLLT